MKPKKSRAFSAFCEDMLSEHDTLILHSEVRFLSRGKVLERFLSLKEEIFAFLEKDNDHRAALFKDPSWLATVHYLCSIFNRLNELNLSLQGKGGDIFQFTSKIKAMKMKIELWKNKVTKGNLSDFPTLHSFLQGNNWGNNKFRIESKIKYVVCEHLDLLLENFNLYFPISIETDFDKEMWIMNPFDMEYVRKAEFEESFENLIDLSQDFSLKFQFQSVGSYRNFWTSILDEKEFKSLAILALRRLVMMPTTYMAEKGFSVLVGIKTKKRNRLKSVDDLM